MVGADRRKFASIAHSFAEAYSTLTRRNASARYDWPAEDAWATLGRVAAATTLIGLTPAQTIETTGRCVESGDIGRRLYDRLIGQTALLYAIPRIITWNVGHMSSRFPELELLDPMAAL